MVVVVTRIWLAMRLYFVRELFAALSLFTLGFIAIAFLVTSLCMGQKAWLSFLRYGLR
jgi:hypothetical protein